MSADELISYNDRQLISSFLLTIESSHCERRNNRCSKNKLAILKYLVKIITKAPARIKIRSVWFLFDNFLSQMVVSDIDTTFTQQAFADFKKSDDIGLPVKKQMVCKDCYRLASFILKSEYAAIKRKQDSLYHDATILSQITVKT